MLITLDVPNDLGLRLRPFKQQLPHLLELGLRELNAPSNADFHSLHDILACLAKLPSPEEIIALRPAPELQQRMASLLDKQRTAGLNDEEEQQWQHYEYLEHLVRIAKANALLKLNKPR
jgi:hypothetical protein